MVPIRLLLVSAWMSSKEMPRTLLGLGLPPEAPMSPPAQLTRISHLAEVGLDVAFIAATASRSPMLPVTAATRVPYRSPSSLGHRAEIGELAVFRRRRPVEVVDGDVGAVLGQPLGHHPAEAASRAGDEGNLAAEFPAHLLFSIKPRAPILAALFLIMSSSYAASAPSSPRSHGVR